MPAKKWAAGVHPALISVNKVLSQYGMAMDAPVSHHLDLYRYWLSKRDSRLMPARSDLSPGDIPFLLPFVIIVGRADGELRYRLIGSAVVKIVGYDATGHAVGSYFVAANDAVQARAIFDRAFTAAGPVFSTGEFNFKSGAHLNMSMLTLPLSDDGMAVNMSISTLVSRFNAPLAAKRGWLKGLPVKVCDVIDVRSAGELEKLCLEWEQRGEPAI
jgi:hypothetical protein